MSRPRRQDEIAGLLVLDKPSGPTSHDVVAQVRRAINMRRVGHAGTLDPMATGVLVVMVGQATKLGPYLTLNDKSYRATVQLGSSTDTLDGEGTPIEVAELPAWWTDQEAADSRLCDALATEQSRTQQLPPAHSAIKLQGKAAYARTRAGETVILEERPVRVHRLDLIGRSVEAGQLELDMTVSKGYYVRSLARDLGKACGIPAHLCALRRTRSGPFDLGQAVPPDEPDLEAHLIPLEAAATAVLPKAMLTPAGADRAGHGGPMTAEDFSLPPSDDQPSAWCDPDGHLRAVGRLKEGRPVVLRGFTLPTDHSEPPSR